MSVRRGSIRLRLMVVTAATVLGGGLVLGAATYALLRANLLEEVRAFALHEAHEVSAVAASAGTAEELEAKRDALQSLFPEESVLTLELWSLDGRLVRRLPAGDSPLFGPWPEGVRVAQRDGSHVGAVPAPDGAEHPEHAVRAAQLVSYANQPRWVAVAVVSTARQASLLETFLRLYSGGLLVATLLALVGGWLLVTRALDPVHALVRDAQRVSDEGPSERLETPQEGSELRELVLLLNAMLARVEETVSRLQTFTAHAGHELRTPLTRIRGEVEAALLSDDAAQARTALESTLEEIDVQRRVLDGLLALARDHEPLELAQQATVDLSTLVEEVSTEADEVAERGVSVETAVQPGLCVRGDRALLARVLWNLLDNALRHSPADGRILLRAALASAGTLAVEIEDEGPGLSGDRLQVFVPFATPHDGHGLGLPLARQIARRHGGELEAIEPSTLPGAAFRLTLPVAPAAPSRASAGTAAALPR